MDKTLEQRVTDLEKRVAALEGQVQAQPKEIDELNSECTIKLSKPIPFIIGPL